jgi:hypothetical protein
MESEENWDLEIIQGRAIKLKYLQFGADGVGGGGAGEGGGVCGWVWDHEVSSRCGDAQWGRASLTARPSSQYVAGAACGHAKHANGVIQYE